MMLNMMKEQGIILTLESCLQVNSIYFSKKFSLLQQTPHVSVLNMCSEF